jgi:hypothetical protein
LLDDVLDEWLEFIETWSTNKMELSTRVDMDEVWIKYE